MKNMILLILLVGLASFNAAAQSDIQNLVNTERAFAQLAAEKGTKHAFLANMTDDGVLFQPDKINGKEFWKSDPESASLLSWAPLYHLSR